MCNEEFMDKEPDKTMDFFDYLAKSASQWNTRIDKGTIATQPLRTIPNGGKYELKNNIDVQAKLTTLARKVELMELEIVNIVKAVKPLLMC